MQKLDSTKSILLTISLWINMCTVLKALREVTSLHLNASSLHQKRQYFITKLFIPYLCYFHICIGDGRQGLTVLNLTWDSFFVKCEIWLMFSLLYLCVQVPTWSCKISDVCIYI